MSQTMKIATVPFRPKVLITAESVFHLKCFESLLAVTLVNYIVFFSQWPYLHRLGDERVLPPAGEIKTALQRFEGPSTGGEFEPRLKCI